MYAQTTSEVIALLYKKLQNTEINASSIVLGTNYFGTTISNELSFQMMDTYLEKGGNVLDTARIYASWLPNGEGASEKTIGEYMKTRNNRRNIIISTKCAHPPLGKMNINRLSPFEIESDIDQSLLALDTDYIDILWLHRDDIGTPVNGIIDTLDSMVKKGKILYYGASNWTGKRIGEANRYAKCSGKMPFIASQIKWSLAKSGIIEDNTLVEMDDVEFEFYSKTKMPVFAYSPQAKGFFTKYDNDKNNLGDKANSRYLSDENLKIYNNIKKISNETGVSISAIVLAYITSQKNFDGLPIIGCSNIEQLCDSLSYTDFDFDINAT